jgi:hypothetical protein
VSQHRCPYCADLDAFGLLPAREVAFAASRHDIPPFSYGSRLIVTSLIHFGKNGPRSVVTGIRCYNDTNAAERIAEDAAAKPINAVEAAGV